MKIAALLLLPFLAVPALALEPNQTVFGRDKQGDTYTLGWPNGRYWASLDAAAKAPFLDGVDAGMDYLATELSNLAAATKIRPAMAGKIKKVSLSAFRRDEVVQVIDGFYGEPANVLVPVPYAVEVAAMKLTGKSGEEITAYTEILRAFWAKHARS